LEQYIMHRYALGLSVVLVMALAVSAGQPANGWRGNGTGLFPKSTAPLEWYRRPKGVITDIRTRAERPADKAEGQSLEKGIVREWLVLGPLPVADSVQDFDKPQLDGEDKVEPSENDKVGELAWKKLASTLDDPFAFGPAALPFTDVAAAIGGYKTNQIAYLHAYLHSAKGGRVRAVVEHGHGLKAWLNGKQIYRAPGRGEAMGFYYSFSRVEFGNHEAATSPRFELELKPGWNRLLLKIGTANMNGYTDQHLLLRLHDLPDVPYESKNIVWMTELPQRSNAAPVVAGDRVFVMAEPDELICIDKNSGKVLWTAANNYYEALTPEERKANPAFAKTIDPLVVKIREEKDFAKRLNLRVQLQRELVTIDAGRFARKADGHFEAHFGIVGFTSPTPVSDGKNVWVWCGNGVAASYDLDGKRRWIKRLPAKELTYCSSPALNDGIFAVHFHKLIGLDADTGEVRWEQDKITVNNAATLAATIAGVPVFVSQRAHVIRARDGKALLVGENPTGDTGWAPPTIHGNIVYAPNYGAKHLNVMNYTGVRGDAWKPKIDNIQAKGVNRLPNGRTSGDRWTAGAPLVVGDLAYMIDIYAAFYAFDLKAKQFVYQHDTGLRGYFHYNALAIAASPTLVGKNIVVQDNQGTAVVLEPGRKYRQIARNELATQLDRFWPIPQQETTGYAPPVADGDRLYIRGERYLYCIGKN
jgi:outer membrane protein assembly factor BamB